MLHPESDSAHLYAGKPTTRLSTTNHFPLTVHTMRHQRFQTVHSETPTNITPNDISLIMWSRNGQWPSCCCAGSRFTNNPDIFLSLW